MAGLGPPLFKIQITRLTRLISDFVCCASFWIYSRTDGAKGEEVAGAHPIDGTFRDMKVLGCSRGD